MKALEISSLIERFAPTRLAASWDNVGWQVGDRYQDVRGVLLAVDFSQDVLEEALALRSDLIITHHPFLFRPLSKIDLSDRVGSLIGSLIRNEISLYAAHTNLDVAPEGVSFALADRLGLKGIRSLRLLEEAAAVHQGDPTEVLSLANAEERLGWGAIGETEEPITTEAMVALVQDRLGPLTVRVVKGNNQNHHRIAVCGGSGSDFIHDASLKATLFITSDVKYHQAQECADLGLTLIDIPHFNGEKPVLDTLSRHLRKHLQLPVYVSKVSTSPFVNI